MTIGQKMKTMREQQRMTLAQVAKEVGVSEATIQRYESGDIRHPPIERVIAVAAALSVPASALLGIEVDDLDGDVRLIARDLQSMPPKKREKAAV